MSPKGMGATIDEAMSEETASLIFEKTSVGLGIVDRSGRIFKANSAMLELTGYPQRELSEINASDMYADPNDRLKLLESLERDGEVTNREARLRNRQGEERWARLSVSVIEYEGQEALLVTAIDITKGRRVENELRNSEIQNRTTIDGLVDPLHVVDRDLRIVLFNAAFEQEARALGVSGDMIGQGLFDLFPCHGKSIKDEYERVFATGELLVTEEEGEYGGGVRFTETRKIPIRENREVVRVITIIRDITDRKQVEAALRESEGRNRTLINRIPDPIFISANETHCFLDCNRSALRRYGYSLEELRNMTPQQLHPPEEHAEVSKRIDDEVDAAPHRYSHVTKGGELIQVEIHTAAIEYEGHEAWLSVVRDITEHQQAEEGLRGKELFFRKLIETAGAVPYRRNNQTNTYDYIGEGIERLTGYSSSTITPDILESITQETIPLGKFAGIPADDARRKARSAPGMPWRAELRIISRSGEVRWVEDSMIYKQKGEPGKAKGSLGLIYDITERKLAEEEREKLQAQLSQAQKMESVGRLAGGVAHDFNNMLGVILGHVEMAMEQVDPGEPLRLHLEEIHKATERSAAVTRQLLAFARQQPVAPRILELNETVGGMLSMLRRLIGEEIDLTWMPGGEPWSVLMDSGQVDQILANLCVNARDAISGVGKITIETRNVTVDEAYCSQHPGSVPGECVLLAVNDDGCGMEKEILTRIFEPFYTTKGVGEGTGLGLSTVYGIVKQNQGFVNVYSEQGVGTTFRIYFPRYTEERTDTEVAGMEEAPLGGGETILLVEDEEGLLGAAGGMLQRLGYRVLAAGGPGEAIRLAQKHGDEIDLLLTDVVMPQMNGRELVGRIREVAPGLKCLYMSGYSSTVIAHRGILDEGVLLIEKPFDRQSLATKIREALAQK